MSYVAQTTPVNTDKKPKAQAIRALMKRDEPATTAAAPPPEPTPAAAPLSDPPASKPTGTYVAEPTHEVPAQPDPLLVRILSWPRRHDSHQELLFNAWVREQIKTITGEEPVIMAKGCIVHTVKRQPTVDGTGAPLVPEPSTTLFSCHMDTIDPEASNPARPQVICKDGTYWDNKTNSWQKWEAPPLSTTPDTDTKPTMKALTYDPNFGLIALEKDSIGGSLGADDGAGVWIMLKMIEAGVPGTYIFHRGEEVGGVGSSEMAKKYPDFLKTFDIAIAFDRHHTGDVITHQRGGRTASDKFAKALCEKLNDVGFSYAPCTGVFTDTANYKHIIAECTNISVGYDSQHGRNESLDFAHLNALLPALIALDWDGLPADRDPSKPDYEYSGGRSYGGYSGGHYAGGGYGRTFAGDDLFDDEDAERGEVLNFPRVKSKKPKAKKPQDLVAQLRKHSIDEIEAWVKDYPVSAATALCKLIVECGKQRELASLYADMLGWKEDLS